MKEKVSAPIQEQNRLKYIALAGWIALLGNLALAVLKLTVGFISNSLAVLGDGIDSATDVVIACMTLFIGKIISRPSDKEHPWGHGRAETVATLAVAFIIFYAGSQLIVSSGKQFYAFFVLKETPGAVENIALIITIASVFGKLLLAVSQFLLGKKADSSIILANAQNMSSDIVISFSVLIGLGCAKLLHQPVLDPVVAFLVGLWVVKNAIKLFLEMNMELMDGTQDKELYHTLFSAIKSVPGVTNPHRVRIRKIASKLDIDLDIEVDASITVHEAHIIAEEVEKKIRNSIPDIYDIMVHIEPADHGDHHPKEQYGLTEEELDNK